MKKEKPGWLSGFFFLDLKLDLKMEAFFHAACADFYARAIRDTSPLEIRIDATVSARIVLGSTNTVGVLANNLRSFCAERTDVCHRFI